MYVDELISRDELNTKAKDINEEAENIRSELRLIDGRAAKGDSLQKELENMFSSAKAITTFEKMTNTQLRQIISKITVDKSGKIDVYFDLLDELKIGSDFRFVTTVHKDLTEKLPKISPSMFPAVKEILETNKRERHIRGGLATKHKYEEQHKTDLHK